MLNRKDNRMLLSFPIASLFSTQSNNKRALGRDQNGAVTDCEGSALRASPSSFFLLITSAIMKAPYYYQLALWLVGSGNEHMDGRTDGRTLRYSTTVIFFSATAGERVQRAIDRPRKITST